MPPPSFRQPLRYSNSEKQLLYDLFKQYEDIIDIKQRKLGKFHKTKAIRTAWSEILDSYNKHDQVETKRNLKQLQKFWLNARLRRSFPGKHCKTSDETAANKSETTEGIISTAKDSEIENAQNPDTSIDNSAINDDVPLTKVEQYILGTENDYEFSQQDYDVYEQARTENEAAHQDGYIETILLPNSDDGEDTEADDESMLTIDRLSPDKLTLSDLLEFKSTNTSEIEYVIRNSCSPLSKKKKLSSGVIIEKRIKKEKKGTASVIANEIGQKLDQNKNKSQPERTGQCRGRIEIQDSPAESTLLSGEEINKTRSTQTLCCERYHQELLQKKTVDEEKVNFWRAKEAEMRFKEQQTKLRREEIELEKASDELEHKRTLNQLQISEMRIKLRILGEHERRLRGRDSN